MPHPEHRACRIDSVTCAIVTVSDTRTMETDISGALIRERLESQRHKIVSYDILRDEPSEVREHVLLLCEKEACQVVLLTGGTGLAPRDTTYELIMSILEKRLDGFGELFRMLSFRQIGAAAMLSRASAGVCRRALVFSMPGSPEAVRLAMDELIQPHLGHIAWLLRSPLTPFDRRPALWQAANFRAVFVFVWRLRNRIRAMFPRRPRAMAASTIATF